MSSLPGHESSDECAAATVDAADVFTVEELWMLYGIVHGEVADHERAERLAHGIADFDLSLPPLRALKAKLRLQIERSKP